MEQKEAEKEINSDILTYVLITFLFTIFFISVYNYSEVLMYVSLGGLMLSGIRLTGLMISWGIIHAKKYD